MAIMNAARPCRGRAPDSVPDTPPPGGEGFFRVLAGKSRIFRRQLGSISEDEVHWNDPGPGRHPLSAAAPTRRRNLAPIRPGHRRALGWLAAALLMIGAAPPPVTGSESPAAERAQLDAEFADQLAHLADWAEAQGLASEAQQTRDWLLPTYQDKQIVYRIADGQPSAAASADAAEWQRRFRSLRELRADALFVLVKPAAEQEQVSLAFELLYATLRENPEHEAARRLLGHKQYQDRWYAPNTLRRIEQGEVWHERFGWLPADHVARYEQGERRYGTRWITAEREAELRRSIARGWHIETEHFDVTTNHSLEEGVALARRLEQLHAAWFQVFAAFHTTPKQLQQLIRYGKPSRRPPARHKVVYFATRDEYVNELVRRQPGIERSLGVYFANRRTAYFFAGEDQDPGTVLHEATHQLFQETASLKQPAGQKRHAWVVEGIACYMESLRDGQRSPWGGFDTVGGYHVARLPGARIRLLEDRFYIPFAELTRMGLWQLNRHPQAATVYTQIAGQATFLMHYSDGHYRDALVQYLRAVYGDRASPAELAELAEESFGELDLAYRQFLLAAEADAEARAKSGDSR
ncbi:MAG: DUF1570 domain-containing protein [Planctomycetota bacterium]|nr:MAG: DUF1570 domain-containing protein [Planctomycetota bacterium]